MMEELAAWKLLSEALSDFCAKSQTLTAEERSVASAALCSEYARLAVSSIATVWTPAIR